ncbi:MAG TPA: sigma 54-interacting transcriptional regulator [Solimonas sp.]|nr:sigma 54-interacting transcriptional regulator [Solimonas sp.]
MGDQEPIDAETRLRLVIDAIPQQIWSGPPDGTLDFCNARWRAEKGLVLAELQGDGWQVMLHPCDRQRVLEAWQHSVATGAPYEQEERHRMADGSFRWYLARGVPLRDERGRIVRWYGTNTDIEELKRVQEALQRSQTCLAEAQRLSQTGSFYRNLVTGERYWSEEIFRILEFEPPVPPPFEQGLQRVHPEDIALVRDLFASVSAEGTGVDREYRLLLPGGRVKHVQLVAQSRRNNVGELEVLGALTDVSASRESMREIRALKDQLDTENLVLKEEIDQTSMFEEIVGCSEALQRVLVNVSKVAPTDSTVLITGESGTGKELVARAIHKRSRRSGRAFIAVNCAAIPAALIASELFGHEKGAFTGATQRRLGRFEVASGGTIFLDEVGDLPVDSQLALLRVLQEREFERVGGSHTVTVDVRVIAASNRDLKAAVAAGSFRQDLFYRLDVFPVALPSLRQRAEDIPLLLQYFCERFAAKAGKRFKGISRRTLELFQRYPWPGNVRELQNVVERGVILCDGETFEIDESWLQPEPPGSRPAVAGGLDGQMVETETRIIEQALRDSLGRVAGAAGAAARLGVPRSSLESRIKNLGIKKHQFKRS